LEEELRARKAQLRDQLRDGVAPPPAAPPPPPRNK